MTIRHLDSLFDPASVAVIGASTRPDSVGGKVWRNLQGAGFAGPMWPVNRRGQALDGVPVWRSVAELPAAPELAVVCVPPDGVAQVIAELGQRGSKAAVVLTAGLTAAQTQAMLDAAKPHVLRVLGPNCLGLQVPRLGLNVSFAHATALKGELALVSQSGALVTAMLDWAMDHDIGFSHLVSLGEHADVDFGDILDWLASDVHSRAILLYIESIQAARKFMSAARSAARNKPVIVVKAGRSQHGQKAAASHTGAMAGSDLVYDAAIRRAGMLRVDTFGDMFVATETLARWRGNTADELLIFTNGGGSGVMATDAAELSGLSLAELSPQTMARLDAVLPANWSKGNPVDIIGDAPAARYVDAWNAMQDDPATRAVLFVHAPTAIVPSTEIAAALVPLMAARPPRVLANWLGGPSVAAAEDLFKDAGIACYPTPEEAVRAFALLVAYRRNQAQLIETPHMLAYSDADGQRAADSARALVAKVLAEGRSMLNEPESKAVLQAYGIAVAATREVADDDDAVVAAGQALGFPVALKVVSPQISHKSDVGGVALDLGDADALRDAVRAMRQRVRSRRPDATLQGYAVQTMVKRSHARELIVGASVDTVFGPVILFGRGGTAVELIADRAIALPPLNEPLALALIQRTRVARLLGAWRDTPAADLDAVVRVLLAVSQLLADVPEVAELDINPLLADDRGAVALDARIRLDPRCPAGAANFAIQPYPAELIEHLPWQGRQLTLRPIRPEDEAQHAEFLQSLAPEDLRLRLFNTRRSFSHTDMARLTQIDYARQLAFIATVAHSGGAGELTLGVVRALSDPDNEEAEFGLIVRSELKGRGLGVLLMDKLLRTLRARGTQRVTALVLRETEVMLALAARLGFTTGPSPDGDPTVVHVCKVLQPPAGA